MPYTDEYLNQPESDIHFCTRQDKKTDVTQEPVKVDSEAVNQTTSSGPSSCTLLFLIGAGVVVWFFHALGFF